MDPCSFVRVLVGNLALKIPVACRPARSGVHPSSTPCFCRISFHNLPCQTAPIPLLPPEDSTAGIDGGLVAAFNLSRQDVDELTAKSLFSGKSRIRIAIYTGGRGTKCGVNSGRLLGKVRLPLDLKYADGRALLFHSGWIAVGKSSKRSSTQLHVTVRSEPDPRFVFEFGSEPECSPQVFQVQGNLRQPMFTCKFSFRNTSADRSIRSRSFASMEEMGNGRSCLKPFGSEGERLGGKERKGWSVTVHDLSGSPVAMASMVTPFVASPGTDRVSRSSPGAWLVLRPGDNTWEPWGRLEAWRERSGMAGGRGDALGYRFELLSMSSPGLFLAESTISMSRGGRFGIDLSTTSARGDGSPGRSGNFVYGSWPSAAFVMSSTVGSERRTATPVVELGVQHVGCAEDAAAFVALAAAIDLCVDACRLFSSKLRKELQPQEAAADGGYL
ncbi:hypothetical protein HPP92_017165 [Vanilla planifolia]|uniref:Formin-like protein 18 n=1 Tax=Vanilla planifolia TaxID=51239 RepID=A0A835QEW3_VANPL|nr:hypothetical protein HPP92_017165 [Vanilla planifolia]